MKIDHLGKLLSVVILILGLAGLWTAASGEPQIMAQKASNTEETESDSMSSAAAEQEQSSVPETASEVQSVSGPAGETDDPANQKDEEKGETESETETEEPVYFRENREVSQYTKVIMVGDSRFVGMSSAVSFAGCEWICEVSVGMDWLAETAAPQIDAALEENCAIVFNLGVNDIERYSDYVNFLNSRVEDWTSAGADVYFMSVNPVDRAYTGTVTNAAIVTFNDVMASNLSPWFGYIDTYNDMTSNGFTSRDGLHYTNETYVTIFQYCMNQLHVVIS